jgi:hypothetical protein
LLTPHPWQIWPLWLASDAKLLLLSAVTFCRCFGGWCLWLNATHIWGTETWRGKGHDRWNKLQTIRVSLLLSA